MFEPNEFFLQQAADLELQLPQVGISHELEIRLKRHLYRLEPDWAGLLSATKRLELEYSIGLTYGLDPKDDDADPEVEQYPAHVSPRDDSYRRNDVELAIHVDPTPSSDERSLQNANVATWMALLIGKDLGEPGGQDLLIEKFRSDKMKSRVAAFLGHMGVVGGNAAVQTLAISPSLHALSWLGWGSSMVGHSIYQAHVGNQVRELRDGPEEIIVELVDTQYRDEAEELAKAEPDLVDYNIS